MVSCHLPTKKRRPREVWVLVQCCTAKSGLREPHGLQLLWLWVREGLAVQEGGADPALSPPSGATLRSRPCRLPAAQAPPFRRLRALRPLLSARAALLPPSASHHPPSLSSWLQLRTADLPLPLAPLLPASPPAAQRQAPPRRPGPPRCSGLGAVSASPLRGVWESLRLSGAQRRVTLS